MIQWFCLFLIVEILILFVRTILKFLKKLLHYQVEGNKSIQNST
jgi:hypothetical protein